MVLVALKPGDTQAADGIRDWLNEQVGKTLRVAAVMIVPALDFCLLGRSPGGLCLAAVGTLDAAPERIH